MNNINKMPTSEDKHRMIETAAYFRAQKRGFSDADPVADWLEAEREIEVLLQQEDDTGSNRQEVAAAAEKIGPRWNTISEKSHGLFEIWKGKGGQFLNEAHTALNNWVRRHQDKNG